jgi:hypothetical protein
MFSELKVGEVYTFKTSGGEEIVAKLHSDGKGMIIQVVNPVSVAHGGQGMGLIPSMITADHEKSVQLNTNNILMVCEADENVKNKYIELTTGLKLPGKKLILG